MVVLLDYIIKFDWFNGFMVKLNIEISKRNCVLLCDGDLNRGHLQAMMENDINRKQSK